MPLNNLSSPVIFVVGSFVTGITIRVLRQPVIGETLIGNDFNLGPGGKGFNQAIAASRAGAIVNVILCTGKDIFAEMAEKTLEKEGISTELLFKMGHINTGCGLVTLLQSGENSIIIDIGANAKLNPEMISQATEHIAKSKVLMAQLEVPDEAIEKALFLGKKHGCVTILNPAPARLLLPAILKNTDILTPNETEAKILLGIAPDADVPLIQISQGLLALGIKIIIMTRGKHGAVIITKKEIIEIPAPTIIPFDSTGAGDCFNGNLACALAKGIPLKEAVKRAVYAGAFCTQYLGVIDGLPHTGKLDTYINQDTSLISIN
jgi:ribokinase